MGIKFRHFQVGGEHRPSHERVLFSHKLLPTHAGQCISCPALYTGEEETLVKGKGG